MGPPRHTVQAVGQAFIIDAEYEYIKDLGQGAYGCVLAAKHRRSGDGCAIKKITNINTKKILTKRCLREIKLLHHFRGHKNITCLYDMDIIFDAQGNFHEVYCYEELMEADLHAIIRSGQPLSDAHFQSFIYQTLCGLKYIHSANVLHRDLKPGNLLVNADCELKICDFGLARGLKAPPQGDPHKGGFMTEYVATRWYRAPEIMLSFANYSSSIDTWSIGCILAELLGGKPIFKGRDYVDQLNQILHYLGTPSEDTLRRVGSPRAQDYIRSLPIRPRIPFSNLYPHANPQAIDLLTRMLCFDPAKRITCEEALSHPYLAVWHDPNDEPLCHSVFDFGFEEEDTIDGMKRLIVDEVNTFRTLVRNQARQAQPRRQDTLPIPTREEIINSPIVGNDGATSSFTFGPDAQKGQEGHFIVDEPSADFERELQQTHHHDVVTNAPSSQHLHPGHQNATSSSWHSSEHGRSKSSDASSSVNRSHRPLPNPPPPLAKHSDSLSPCGNAYSRASSFSDYGHQPQRSRGLSGASGDVHSENPPSAASDSHLNQRSKGRRSYANARGAKGASFSNARKQDDYITFGSRAAGKGASRSAPTYDFDGQEPPRRGIVSSIFRGCF